MERGEKSSKHGTMKQSQKRNETAKKEVTLGLATIVETQL